MKYAYVVGGVVQVVTDTDMSSTFGFTMQPCPDETEQNWLYDAGTQTYSAPPPPPPEEVPLQLLSNDVLTVLQDQANARRLVFVNDYIATNGPQYSREDFRAAIANMELPT